MKQFIISNLCKPISNRETHTHTHTSSSPEMKAQYAGEISQFVSECERKGLNHLKYCLEAVRNC